MRRETHSVGSRSKDSDLTRMKNLQISGTDNEETILYIQAFTDNEETFFLKKKTGNEETKTGGQWFLRFRWTSLKKSTNYPTKLFI